MKRALWINQVLLGLVFALGRQMPVLLPTIESRRRLHRVRPLAVGAAPPAGAPGVTIGKRRFSGDDPRARKEGGPCVARDMMT
jgi:hypothetical protein